MNTLRIEDDLGRCEGCGHYVLETELESVELDGEELLTCAECTEK